MRKSTLKSFEINGLFGTKKSFKVPFNQDVKILIGENGLGKTTILNLLYHTLNLSFHRLLDYNFDYLVLEFSNKRSVEIKRSELDHILDEIDFFDDPGMRTVRSLFAHSDLDPATIVKAYRAKKISKYEILDLISGVNSDRMIRRLSPNHIVRLLEKFVDKEKSTIIAAKKKLISESLSNSTILYFPTYRRIEEDLRNLGFDEDSLKINKRDQRLIQFGMRDVKERFESLKNELESLSSQGLSKISSEILSQLIKGVPEFDDNTIEKISTDDIEIILARVGKALSEDDKRTILSLTKNKEFTKADPMLIYFLQKLISVYEQQRQIDEDIKRFVSICNKYLERSRKKITYNESEVEFYILIGRKKYLLSNLLSKLSSGEKQIISLFSRIYLSKNENFYVLFDEPELSLSIFWQRMLLPDILGSGRCRFLLSVTHSPFIFENELDKYAIGLNEYFI